MTKKRGLGRNLNALLGEAVDLSQIQDFNAAGQSLRELPLDVLQRGAYQPRTNFDPKALAELTASIKQQGVVQPIVVRPLANNRYEIIAGERRWRASQQAGLSTIPAVVKDISDQTALAVALIENIQRQNLNCIEEAKALEQLKQEFKMTDEAVATLVGRQRSSISNLLRLLSLSATVQQYVQQEQLSMGHARALLALQREQQVRVATEIIAKALSVRQTETLVQRYLKASPPSTRSTAVAKDPNVVQLERRLSGQLGTPVSVAANAKGRGKIVVNFSNLQQLQGIIERLIPEAETQI